ncbi:hypothetical protein [Kinneretia aquatilis]|uniref:hypothetical protein n=1 Tax=Kinneretia aquatilis TaxID=2070761 RepID=UPI0014954113|nr:hypothetical protein [Paucibacter aquatile]WIV97647.1 hypothetical protein K9V56_021970 [Paucibacter aquatile]
MDRRAALVVLAGLAGSVAVAEPKEPATIRDLDIEVRDTSSGVTWRLPQLIQRGGVLVVIDCGSRGAAAWLAHELPKLQPVQLEQLVVLLVDRRRPDAPLLAEIAQYPGLRLYRATGDQWPERMVGAVLPQIVAFDKGGVLKSRLLGVGPGRPGIADVMTVLDL